MQKIVVVDYGVSNLRSVSKAIEHVSEGRHQVLVSGDPDQVLSADRIVFPGQGAIGDCMQHMRDLGLDQALKQAITRVPFMGLCLGLQSLLDWSEEDGGTDGLGILPGKVLHFPKNPVEATSGERLKIPHMGWNQITPCIDHPMWKDIPAGTRFYFVHSYYVKPEDDAMVAAQCHYALDFACALTRDNVFAVQFHPEKSQNAGMQLLSNFLDWKP